jgi:uncharacterized membrane protein
MNGAHVHLLLTHLPVLGTLFGLGLGAYAVLFHKPDVLKAALGVFVIAAMLAGAAYFTGEGAEEVAEGIGLTESVVEPHESAAVFALVGAAVLGLLALVVLVIFRARRVAAPLAVGVLVLGLGVMGLMAYTANLGGQIRHAEIRGGDIALDASREADAPASTVRHEEEDD